MNLFSRRRRAPHLGRYKMEKIRRVARPPTDIPDHAPRAMRPDLSTRAAPPASTPLGVSLRRTSPPHRSPHACPAA